MNQTLKVFGKAFLMTILSIFIVLMALVPSSRVLSYANSASDITESDVLDDLSGSTIAGKTFSLSDYSFDENGQPQMISFAEYCYSFYSNQQDNFGLFVYVYNPQGFAFDTSTDRNKLQFRIGSSGNYNKYKLTFINYSTKKGYEGLFYKFQVSLSSTERDSILNSLNASERIYDISGIELSVGGTVKEYQVLDVYTYSGYAEGYGSKLATSDTLTCVVDGFDKYLTLDVHSTYFRPEGTNGTNRYTHDSLSSIYFAVPNDVIAEYGLMTRIRGEYLKALTSEIFVTGTDSYYKEFLSVVGQDVGYLNYNDPNDFQSMILANGVKSLWFDDADWNYNVPEEIVSYYPEDRYFSRLNYVLKASTGDADTYDVSSEELETYMKWYTKNYRDSNEELIVGKYASSLFAWVDSEYTDFDLNSESMTIDMRTEVISQNWWQRLTGRTTTTESTLYEGKEAIHAVTDSDFIYYSDSSNVNISATCDNLYIAESDYDEFKSFYDSNKSNNTIYLIRFAVDDYASTEATECHFSQIGSTGSNKPAIIYENDYDTNCYLAQEYLYLDFDIIDLTFTKNNVNTVIPVVMSPIDIIADVTHPSVTTSDSDGLPSWLKYVIAIACLILLLMILMPIMPYVVQAVVWVVLLPFKVIAALCKGIKKAFHKRE